VRTGRTRLGYRTSRAPAVQRDRATIFWAGANNASFFAIPSGLRAGLERTPGALERSAVIHFAARHIMIRFCAHQDDSDWPPRKRFGASGTCNSAQSVFNLFNIVNTGVPANTIEGTGFGMISKTRGNLTANSVSAEAHLLRRSCSDTGLGGGQKTCVSRRFCIRGLARPSMFGAAREIGCPTLSCFSKSWHTGLDPMFIPHARSENS